MYNNRKIIIDKAMVYSDIQTFIAAASRVDDWTLREITTRWSTIDTCRILSMFWPYRSLEGMQS